MQQLWHGLTWIVSKLLFLATLMVGTLMIIMLPLLLMSGGPATRPAGMGILAWLQHTRWWHDVLFHLQHLSHGQLFPPNPPFGMAKQWQALSQEISTALPITLKLVGSAFIASLLLGLIGGWVMSRLAPGWARKPAWAVSTLLQCVPDLLIAVGLDLALVLIGIALGKSWIAPEMALWQKFLAPTLAMTLLAAPYIARVTATAIDEVRGELFVRTANAKGLPAWRVVVKHIGKSVLIRTWTVLPIVASILISGDAVVEYFMEIHGVGRALVIALSPLAFQWYPDRYMAVLFLLPLVALFTLVLALSQLGFQILDPRARSVAAQATRSAVGARWRFASMRMPTISLPTWATVALWMSDLVTAVPVWLRAMGRALRDPGILLGTVLLLGLIVVAIGAPRIAPYDPTRQFKLYLDASGHIWVPPFEPNREHLLGTDTIGRDTLSRLIYATRYGLLFAALAAPARFLLALLLGMRAAWRGGIWDRLIDWFGIFFTAVPQVVAPLVLMPMFTQLAMGSMAGKIAWGVVCIAVPGVARLASAIRDQTRGSLSLPFLEGAEAVGASPVRVMTRYLLPHMLPQLLTMLVMEVPAVMTLTATLAYFKVSPGGWIGDGDQGVPVISEWGSMMERPLMLINAPKWWMWAPFAALFVALLAFNILGEGLRRRSAARET